MPRIQAAVKVGGKVFVGLHHFAAAQVAAKALKKSIEQLVDLDLDEGFTVNGKYLTRYTVMVKYGIDDAAQL